MFQTLNLKITTESKLKRIDSMVICRPNGNDTALIFDQDLIGGDRQLLQEQICKAHPNVEQCGFIAKSQYQECVGKLEMFGGEFCGNATRSAVWLLTKGEVSSGYIEVSGVNKPLSFEVLEDENVKIEMPIDTNQNVEQVQDGYIVHLEGISHLVVPKLPIDDDNFEKTCKDLMHKYKLDQLPACGVSFYDFDQNKSRFGVYVKSIDSFFDETACGSGTTAIGIVNNKLNNQSVSNIIQPTGENIEFSIDSGVAYIKGKVTNLTKTSIPLDTEPKSE